MKPVPPSLSLSPLSHPLFCPEDEGKVTGGFLLNISFSNKVFFKNCKDNSVNNKKLILTSSHTV